MHSWLGWIQANPHWQIQLTNLSQNQWGLLVSYCWWPCLASLKPFLLCATGFSVGPSSFDPLHKTSFCPDSVSLDWVSIFRGRYSDIQTWMLENINNEYLLFLGKTGKRMYELLITRPWKRNQSLNRTQSCGHHLLSVPFHSLRWIRTCANARVHWHCQSAILVCSLESWKVS